jgi:hypothetical protein
MPPLTCKRHTPRQRGIDDHTPSQEREIEMRSMRFVRGRRQLGRFLRFRDRSEGLKRFWCRGERVVDGRGSESGGGAGIEATARGDNSWETDREEEGTRDGAETEEVAVLRSEQARLAWFLVMQEGGRRQTNLPWTKAESIGGYHLKHQRDISTPTKRQSVSRAGSTRLGRGRLTQSQTLQ